MTRTALKAAGAAQRGDGDAGLDARGIARRTMADDAARAAKVRRNAWLLGGLALFFYVGYIAWMFIRANGG
jgi:hypothetical protein